MNKQVRRLCGFLDAAASQHGARLNLLLALAMLAGVTITVSGCDSATGPSGSAANTVGSISANHGHTAVITDAQLAAGAALLLNIRGNADHPHTVSLIQAEVMQIGRRERVQKESSNDAAHTHIVTFN